MSDIGQPIPGGTPWLRFGFRTDQGRSSKRPVSKLIKTWNNILCFPSSATQFVTPLAHISFLANFSSPIWGQGFQCHGFLWTLWLPCIPPLTVTTIFRNCASSLVHLPPPPNSISNYPAFIRPTILIPSLSDQQPDIRKGTVTFVSSSSWSIFVFTNLFFFRILFLNIFPEHQNQYISPNFQCSKNNIQWPIYPE